MVGFVNITPEVVLAAAAELDLLAGRLSAAAGLNGPTTHVVPSGAEEVSLLAANHFNQAAVSHDQAIAQAILELHHAAATLRTQVASFVAEDLASAASVLLNGAPFGAVPTPF